MWDRRVLWCVYFHVSLVSSKPPFCLYCCIKRDRCDIFRKGKKKKKLPQYGSCVIMKRRRRYVFFHYCSRGLFLWCRWGGVLFCYYTHGADSQCRYTLMEEVYHNAAHLHWWLRSPRGERCWLCIPYEATVFVHKSPGWITMLEHSLSSDFIWRLMTSLPSNFISSQHYSAAVLGFFSLHPPLSLFFPRLVDEVLRSCGTGVWGTFVKWGISSPAFPGMKERIH